MNATVVMWLVKAAGAAALLALAAVGVRSCQEHYRGEGRDEVQRRWDADRTEQARTAERARANRSEDERAKETTMARGAEENARAQAKRDEAVASRDAGVQRSLDGMRGAIARADGDSAARRAAGTCPAASAEADEAATARALLGACTGRYRELDKEAAELASQVIGLQDHIMVVQPEAAQLLDGGAP